VTPVVLDQVPTGHESHDEAEVANVPAAQLTVVDEAVHEDWPTKGWLVVH